MRDDFFLFFFLWEATGSSSGMGRVRPLSDVVDPCFGSMVKIPSFGNNTTSSPGSCFHLCSEICSIEQEEELSVQLTD